MCRDLVRDHDAPYKAASDRGVDKRGDAPKGVKRGVVMREDYLLVVLVPVEQHDESLLEVLQEMLVTKQALTQQMRRYHLWTGHVEREVEQIQHKIQRSVVR